MKIEKKYSIPFPPDQVYASWVSSDTVIAPATAMDIDPQVGGHYRLIIQSPEFDGRNEGQFIEVDAGQHLRYTWEWNGDGEVTEIDVTFSGADDGTEIELIHSGFQHEASRETHDSGWDSYVAGLIDFMKNR